MPFEFTPLDILDVVVVTPRRFTDERGFFAELYKASDFAAAGIMEDIVQVNESVNEGPVLRGLHYQVPPRAQSKLVRVVSGRVFDVAVDIRVESKSYGRWVGRELTAQAGEMLYIPEGFAHGFCVLSEAATVVYYVAGAEYSPEHERGILWSDPEIGIDWPILEPILSSKDEQYPCLKKKSES